MKCDLCGDDIFEYVGTYYEVTGWEQVREHGGANKIAKRQRTGKAAHKSCMEAVLDGRSIDQGTMF